jgi:hypothetical protein
MKLRNVCSLKKCEYSCRWLLDAYSGARLLGEVFETLQFERACPCKSNHAVDVAKSCFKIEVSQDGVPLFVAEEHVSSFV